MLTPQQIEEARQKHGITPVGGGTPNYGGGLQDAWAAADQQQQLANPFPKNPLQKIADGQGKDNIEVSKGALKQGIKDFASVGMQANPILQPMLLKHAPALKAAFDAFDKAVTPTNNAQKEGALNTSIAEMAIPTAGVRKSKVAVTALQKTGSTIKGAGTALKNTIKTPQSPLDEAVEVTSPARYKKDSIASMEKAGLPGGAQKQGVFGTYKAAPNARDTEVAKSVQGIVSTKKGPLDNIVAVNEEIGKVSDNLSTHFAENEVPFNFEDLRKASDLITPDATLKADPAAFKTYARVKENLLTTMNNQLKTSAKASGTFESKTNMADVWDARKVIDQRIEEELGATTFGTPQYTGIKAAALDFRNGFNEFIANNVANPGQMEQVNKMQEFLQVSRARGIEIPDDEAAINMLRESFGLDASSEASARAAVFKDTMQRLNKMYEARGNIAESNYRLLDKNAIQRWVKQNPSKARALEYGIGVAGVGALGNVILN